MKKLISSFCISLSFICVFSQNALYPDHLTLSDHVQVIEDEGSPIFMHEMMWQNQENIDLGNEIELTDLIWGAMTENRVTFYSGNAIFEDDFPFNLPAYKENQSLAELYDLDDPGDLKYTSGQIQSILFVENWFLDKEKLQLNKEVTGILPVRHWARLDPYGEPIPDAKMMMPVAYIPYPEKLSKGAKKKINKRLIPIKKITYEFLLSDIHFLSWYENEISTTMDDIPMVKFLNPLWTNYQVIQWRKVIHDKVFNERVPVFNPQTNEQLSEEDLAAFFGYYKNDNGTYSNPDNMVSEWSTPEQTEITFDEIPNKFFLTEDIYSILFTEEWSIDPETLYIKKKVISITPVFWANEWNYNEEKTWNKKILFRLDLN